MKFKKTVKTMRIFPLVFSVKQDVIAVKIHDKTASFMRRGFFYSVDH